MSRPRELVIRIDSFETGADVRAYEREVRRNLESLVRRAFRPVLIEIGEGGPEAVDPGHSDDCAEVQERDRDRGMSPRCTCDRGRI